MSNHSIQRQTLGKNGSQLIEPHAEFITMYTIVTRNQLDNLTIIQIENSYSIMCTICETHP